MKYTVVFKETLCREVKVEAESSFEANEKGRKMYKNCEVVLGADDFTDCDIYVKEEED